jgi:hypothetical protein
MQAPAQPAPRAAKPAPECPRATVGDEGAVATKLVGVYVVDKGKPLASPAP